METFWNSIDLMDLTGFEPLLMMPVISYKDLWDLGLELYYSNVDWVIDIRHDRYFRAGFLATFDSELRLVNKVQAFLSSRLEWAEISGHEEVDMLCAPEAEKLRANPPVEPSEPPRPSYAVVVSLLAFVYQYLTGNVDRGGSKAYSRSSLDFRDVYIAIVLFLGAYVWIKFRDVAFKGVYSRKLKDHEGRIIKVVHEPRFKPPRENGRVSKRIYLGQYDTPEEASILYRIAAFYYNENRGISLQLDLEDGRWFSIPPMNEGERSPAGLEKREWVKLQVIKVYEEFKKEKAEAAMRLQELQLQPWEDEGFAVSNGHSLGPQVGPAIPVSQLALNPESGMGISNQLDLLQIVHDQQELITYQRQQLQDCWAQISELKQQHYLQQLVQDVNEGVPSNEVEMERSMQLQNHQSFMTLPYAGAEAQEV